MSLCIALFFARYKVHVFSIFIEFQCTKYKYINYDMKSDFEVQKYTFFLAFCRPENQFNGKQGKKLKIQKTFNSTKISMSKGVFRKSKNPCSVCRETQFFTPENLRSFWKTWSLVPFCTLNVLCWTWVKISGTKYKVQYKYRYKYMYILRWRMFITPNFFKFLRQFSKKSTFFYVSSGRR